MSDSTGTHSHDSDPVAADIAERNADSGDIAAGEQVLDEGKVSPDQDEVGDDADNMADATPAERESAADERTDAGAAPIQPEAS